MLTVTLKKDGSMKIGEATIYVKKIKGNSVSVSIDAPKEVRILRGDAKKGPAAA